ncbi:MAG: sulfurtransferase-like selenium metabolism protein YedF [Nitrospirae bacterium]|jgi:selenium metabolism protein YedF|nr:sulfurtransferase-like selenium metabolism protein YedF [Nitrospirota bacterium]
MPIEIDARGLPCPQPVIKTKEALEKANGEELTIILSTSESRDNVLRFLKNSGIEIDKIEEKNGVFYIFTKKTHKLSNNVKQEDYVCSTTQITFGTTIFINKDRIGHGNDELGKNLIKAFISTIKDLSVQPRTLCFMNSGVKLTINGAETVPHLKNLEEKGIEILVCGTCLSFYNIKDKLAVGKISNMYDISEAMLKSSKVITI